MAKLSEVLRERGYVYQISAEKLEEITDGQKRTVYLGVDPTADSIHVGNLAAYMLLRRFADDGHKIILITGGGTGMIGDPKPDVERPLLDEKTIAERVEKLKKQAEKLLGGIELKVINNADWLTRLNLVEFLRDTGKYFTVNNLVKKEAIEARMESDEGISFTEFTYPLLQAYDFWHLFREYGCDVQIGGSDQWGNIVAGVDLIRRKENKVAYALTIPIITDKATGRKFGKSEGNAVWLDPEKTSPFAFYQFWLNASDESVEYYLNLFTLLSANEIDAVMELQRRNPKERHAQKLLAREVTAVVHGEKILETVQRVTELLFSDADIRAYTADELTFLKHNAGPIEIPKGTSVANALVLAGLAPSKKVAREYVKDGAIAPLGSPDEVTMSGWRAFDPDSPIDSHFREGVLVLKRGKRNVCVLALK